MLYKPFHALFFKEVSKTVVYYELLSSSQALAGMDPGWISRRKQIRRRRNTRRDDESDHKRKDDGHVQDQPTPNESSQQPWPSLPTKRRPALDPLPPAMRLSAAVPDDGQGENGSRQVGHSKFTSDGVLETIAMPA